MATGPVLLSSDEALRWEFLRRFRSQLPYILASQLVLPAFGLLAWLHYALRFWTTGHAPTYWELPPQVHLVLMIIQLAATVLVVLPFCTPSRRQFVLPVSSEQLSRTMLSAGMAAVALTLMGTTLIVNLLWWTWYPVIAPALYGAASLAVGVVIELRYRGRPWMIFLWGSLFAGAVYLALLRHFFTGWTFVVEHAWTDLSATECVAILGVIIGALLVLPGATQRVRLGIGPAPTSELANLTVHIPALLRSRSPALTFIDWELRTQSGMLVVTGLCIGTFLYGTAVLAMFAELWQHGRPVQFQPFVEPTVMMGVGLFMMSGLMVLGVTPRGRAALIGTPASRWPLLLPLSDRRMADLTTLSALLGAVLGAVGFMLLGAAAHLVAWSAMALSTDHSVRMVWERNLFSTLANAAPEGRTVQACVGAAVRVLAVGWSVLGICQAAILTGQQRWACLPLGILLSIPLVAMFGAVVQLPQAMYDDLFLTLLAIVPVGLSLFGIWGTVTYQSRPWRRVAVAVGLYFLMTWLILATEIDWRPKWINWLVLLSTAVTCPITLPPLAVRLQRHAE
jgi:hypothetical protein